MKQAMFVHEEDQPKGEKAKRKYVKSGNYATGKPEAKKKKQKPADPIQAEHSSHTFLFFMLGTEEFTESVPATDAEQRAREIFADAEYQDLQQIYFMKPLKLFNRPVMEITEL